MNLPHDERLDNATAARLGKLAARPVDTSALEKRLRNMMPSHAEPAAAVVSHARWWRVASSIAAGVVIVALVGWMIVDGGTSVAMAAPAGMAQIHRELVQGKSPYLTATTIEQANQILAQQYAGAKLVPDDLPGNFHACCLRSYAGTTLSCALIERNGSMMTVAVADGAKLASPKGNTITRDGRTYIVHSSDAVNMVMTNHEDRWLCVMGEQPIDEVADVAAAIDF